MAKTATLKNTKVTQKLAASHAPVYLRLAEKLKNELLVGPFKSGSAFLSNRELVARHGISLLTVRRALDVLVKEKLLEQRQGSGTFVSENIESARSAARKKEVRQDAVLFSGWGLDALSGWDAMYFRDIFVGLKNAALERGLRVLSDSDLESGPDLAERAAQLGVRGAAILLGSNTHERAAELSHAGLKTLTINFKIPGLPSIFPDDFTGAKEAVAEFVRNGHQRIAHINSGEKTQHWVEVRRGFEAAVKEHGLNPEECPVVIHGKQRAGSIVEGKMAAFDAMRLHPGLTALFCGNDLMAIGAIEELRSNSIRVPQDVSVIGFDNIAATEICLPKLSSMAVDREKLGRRALEMLLDNNTTADAQDIQPIKFVSRDSIAKVPEQAAVLRLD